MAYNPLDKTNLARGIEREVLSQPWNSLQTIPAITGAGVYVLRYLGSFYPYLAKQPIIYIGKISPKGSRKGPAPSNTLEPRLRQHKESIVQAHNLAITDFHCQFLEIDDLWIAISEALLIERFRPIWNHVIEGFGNRDPGLRRAQYKSAWDSIHPGRAFAAKLPANPVLRPAAILQAAAQHHGRLHRLTAIPSVALAATGNAEAHGIALQEFPALPSAQVG
jgi:hypothetical protein